MKDFACYAINGICFILNVLGFFYLNGTRNINKREQQGFLFCKVITNKRVYSGWCMRNSLLNMSHTTEIHNMFLEVSHKSEKYLISFADIESVKTIKNNLLIMILG